jgi:ElaB/YqjD/DUF883 family membrane-anchored ribosome-binding protein
MANAQEDPTPLANVRQKVTKVATDVQGKFQDVSKDVRRGAERASDEIKKGYERASQTARDGYDEASRNLRKGYKKVRKDFDGLTKDVNEYVRDNPGKSVLIAAGVGFVIGLLFRGGRDE